jgi:hypothetical protein
MGGSNQNVLKNLTIKNATVGMLVSNNDGTTTPTIDMMNVQIYNCANVGILARTGNITGKNVVINNCGQASLACTYGGSYDFTHCTFANYWNSPSQTSLVLTNENLSSSVQTSLTQANFKNCIFYGSSNYGIALEKTGAVFNYKFDNCLIKFVDYNNQITSNPLYQFSTNTSKYEGCIFASNSTSNKPEFKNTSINDFRINENSICRNNANYTYSFPLDIVGVTRTNPSDIGAYEYLP